MVSAYKNVLAWIPSNHQTDFYKERGEFVKAILLVLMSVSLVCGCSTIVKGKYQTVSINSNVKGAEIVVNGAVIGTTPFNGPLERDSAMSVTVRKEGYQPKTVVLDTSIEPMFWGNIIIGGFFGSTTDASTGDMYKYSPSTIEIDLEPAVAEK